MANPLNTATTTVRRRSSPRRSSTGIAFMSASARNRNRVKASGALVCIAPKGSGDITQTGKAWDVCKNWPIRLDGVSIADGLLYTGEFTESSPVLTPNRAKRFGRTMPSAYLGSDAGWRMGRFTVGNESGVLDDPRRRARGRRCWTVDFKDPIYSTPVAANGVVYIATGSNLFALERGR